MQYYSIYYIVNYILKYTNWIWTLHYITNILCFLFQENSNLHWKIQFYNKKIDENYLAINFK